MNLDPLAIVLQTALLLLLASLVILLVEWFVNPRMAGSVSSSKRLGFGQRS